MGFDFKTISLENINDVLHVIRAAPNGFVFRFEPDIFKFLMLSRFCNFSYSYSYLGYVGNKPAGLMLNSTDVAEREAFSFYWGVQPQFQHLGLGEALLETYLGQLRRENYLRAHGNSYHQSPKLILEKLGYRAKQELLELQIDHAPAEGPDNQEFEIRTIKSDELFAQWPAFHTGAQNWTRRSNFIRNAAPLLEIIGAYEKNGLEAYAILSCWGGHTVIVDIEYAAAGGTVAYQKLDLLLKENYPNRDFQFNIPGERAARQLLNFISREDFPLPYIASFIPLAGPTHSLLERAGFVIRRRFASMTLELLAS